MLAKVRNNTDNSTDYIKMPFYQLRYYQTREKNIAVPLTKSNKISELDKITVFQIKWVNLCAYDVYFCATKKKN